MGMKLSMAWLSVGDMLCMLESMPPFGDRPWNTNEECFGLCGVIECIDRDDLESWWIAGEMGDMINELMELTSNDRIDRGSGGYIFPKREWVPRAMLAYMLAEFYEEQGR